MVHPLHVAAGDELASTPIPKYYDEGTILRRFLSDMGHGSFNINGTNKRLEATMRDEMERWKIGCKQLERTLHLSASLIEMAYNQCSFEEKKNMALFNWYLIYIDDVAAKDPAVFATFEQRFLRRQQQLHPVLDALAEVLLRMWELYEPLCANALVSATFDFVTSCCIEHEIERLPLIRGAHRLPWFVRQLTGVAMAFAIMMFTKSAKFKFMDILQAASDMEYWINLTNDLLSFHKEELAGETTNYVHNRAYVNNKAPLQVLAEMTEELAEARDTIHITLARNPKALRAWQIFEQGYVLSSSFCRILNPLLKALTV